MKFFSAVVNGARAAWSYVVDSRRTEEVKKTIACEMKAETEGVKDAVAKVSESVAEMREVVKAGFRKANREMETMRVSVALGDESLRKEMEGYKQWRSHDS